MCKYIFRKKSFAAVLAILGATILSSWYDACITCELTEPLEKYVITTISEIFNDFGFKFHSAHHNRDVEMFRMSLRRLDGNRHLVKQSKLQNSLKIWTGIKFISMFSFQDFRQISLYSTNSLLPPYSLTTLLSNQIQLMFRPCYIFLNRITRTSHATLWRRYFTRETLSGNSDTLGGVNYWQFCKRWVPTEYLRCTKIFGGSWTSGTLDVIRLLQVRRLGHFRIYWWHFNCISCA